MTNTGAFLRALPIVGGCIANPAAGQQAVFGEWRVTGSMCPTECAISQREAESWRGRIATYDDTLARFDAHRCARPRYTVGYWPASGVYGGARLQDLGISGDSAMVVDVQCPTRPQEGPDPRWQEPGGFLIVKDRNHLLMVWEGVFFELTRR
ncbi:MAG TPA: hypothetical protein VLB49_00215 [Gemmatimonadales bacterium]|nr:hypothetical protein [Gemmatimonadales bacterium]